MIYEKLSTPDVVQLIPKVFGAAVGFQYKCTNYHSLGDEYCIRWDDPTLAIDWPLVGGKAPRLSEKDGRSDSFVDAVKFA